MKEQAVLSIQSSRGQVEIRTREYTRGRHIAIAYLDGKYTGQGSVLQLRQPKPSSRGTITHYIDGKPAVGLTGAEARQVETAIDAANRAWTQTPEGQAAALRRDREALVATIQGLIEQAEAAFERAYEAEDVLAYQIKEREMAKVAPARQALREFDEAHPEILTAIKAERETAAGEHMWD